MERARDELFCEVPGSVADGRFTVYACGSGEKGQLGNGRTGEHIATGNRTGFDIESEPSETISSNLVLAEYGFSRCLQSLSRV